MVIDPTSMNYVSPPAPPPDILTMSDLLNDQSVVVSKEQADKTLLETIGAQTVSNLRPKLVEWVLKGQPSAFPLLSLDIQPPACCSDGVSRSLHDYIQFCSGKSISEHVGLLQVKLPDISVSFANISGMTTIVVVKV